jgi:hypothetical protein
LSIQVKAMIAILSLSDKSAVRPITLPVEKRLAYLILADTKLLTTYLIQLLTRSQASRQAGSLGCCSCSGVLYGGGKLLDNMVT